MGEVKYVEFLNFLNFGEDGGEKQLVGLRQASGRRQKSENRLAFNSIADHSRLLEAHLTTSKILKP